MPTTKTIPLPVGTYGVPQTWTVPPDWNNSSNSITINGGGGGGQSGRGCDLNIFAQCSDCHGYYNGQNGASSTMLGASAAGGAGGGTGGSSGGFSGTPYGTVGGSSTGTGGDGKTGVGNCIGTGINGLPGGQAILYNVQLTPNASVSYTVGAGGLGGQLTGAFRATPGANGGNGSITVQYTIYTSVPGTQISMDDLANTYPTLAGTTHAKPYLLNDFHSGSIRRNSVGFPNYDPQYAYVMVLRNAYHNNYNIGTSNLISVLPNIPTSPDNGSVTGFTTTKGQATPISLGQFAGRYQTLDLRDPVTITAPSGPPNGRYAEWDRIVFNYTGSYQTFPMLNAKILQIECYGGESQYYNSSGTPSGVVTPGGVSIGYGVFPSAVELYVYVGGRSRNNTDIDGVQLGGWNGGGNGYQSNVFSGSQKNLGGAGATDVRTIANSNPLDATSLASRIIVAGGAGGGAYYNSLNNFAGGAGGGTVGLDAISGTTTYSYGGTQTSGGLSAPGQGVLGAGQFGYGDSRIASGSNLGSGGGGGWYGGGTGAIGAGGSGYLNTSVLTWPGGTNTTSAAYARTEANAQHGLCIITIRG